MTKQWQQDQNFDQIADKFEKNIYGTSKGRLRHELLSHYLRHHLPERPLKCLDAGGGTGMMAKEMLDLGHSVLVNDISDQALELARAKLAGFADVAFHCGPLQSLAADCEFDLILCHAVLEWLHDPFDALKHLFSRLKPGGYISLSFFNRDAHRFSNLLYGNFDYIDKDFVVSNRVRLNPNNALPPSQVLDFVEKAGLDIRHQAGIRCFHDYMRDKTMQSSHYEQIKAKEIQYGTVHPYLWLGRYFHIIAVKQDARL
ncbi:methyltransferase domain-containing protein [Lacimicrobium alkaliphilum]|uniref:tRNA 5-carboxymethoxyuridine methyltransferase n=1 Tax=Lacimicrobium alkaliphilum TaxID=1526571 RepID=A0ABQ1RT64_9ALTE|nr:methyltransferase domain-containing protein [Lacimicrobium alkaliphilum]GGD77946.1 tRNA 5-carboxymethoxyuridine methyltransferase [Lacimicrobium alkaliphilum]